jgi:hypothetical protein
MRAQSIIEAIRATMRAPVGNRVPLLIEGPPGIGKTECAHQAAAAEGGYAHNPNAEVTDPVDVGGFPKINGDASASYTRPWIMPAADDSRPAILFVDEADKMLPSAQAAWLSIIQNREVHGHRLGDNVTIVLAANRLQDRTGGHNLIPALRSRVAAVTMETDLDGWCNWALSSGVPVEVIAFNRFRPELHHKFDPKRAGEAFPCPRSHVNVGKIVACGHSREAEAALICGSVGEGCGGEYAGFFQVYRSLPSLDGILLDPAGSIIPEEPATLYAVTTGLAARASEQNFGAVAKYAARLPDEFSVFMIAAAVRKNSALIQTRAFIDWSAKHSAVLI